MKQVINILFTFFHFTFLVNKVYSQRYTINKDYPGIDYYKFGFGPEQRLQEDLNYYVQTYKEKKVKEVRQYVQVSDSKGLRSKKYLVSKEYYNRNGFRTADEKYVLTEDFKTKLQKCSVYKYHERNGYLDIVETRIGPKVLWPYLTIVSTTPHFSNDTVFIKITQKLVPTWESLYTINKIGYTTKSDTIFKFSGEHNLNNLLINEDVGFIFKKTYYLTNTLRSFLQYRPEPKILFEVNNEMLTPKRIAVDYLYNYKKAKYYLNADSSFVSLSGVVNFNNNNQCYLNYSEKSLLPFDKNFYSSYNKNGLLDLEFLLVEPSLSVPNFNDSLQIFDHSYLGYIKNNLYKNNLLTKEFFKIIDYLGEKEGNILFPYEDMIFNIEFTGYTSGIKYPYGCIEEDSTSDSPNLINNIRKIKKKDICTISYKYFYY